MIKRTGNSYRYYDKNLVEIKEGRSVRYPNGVIKKAYKTENGELGTDATSHKWIESGMAAPCEYGIYPFDEDETNQIEVIGE